MSGPITPDTRGQWAGRGMWCSLLARLSQQETVLRMAPALAGAGWGGEAELMVPPSTLYSAQGS